jgi:phenylpyruvate tautomerase PptA (4-oxalocrotonate tautomerase family)
MADDRGIGLSAEQKTRLANSMAEATMNFLKQDSQITQGVAQITDALANYVTKNPEVFASGADPKSLEEILEALRSRGAGGNVSGGASISLQDVADFIKQISGLVDAEKRFFLEIIKLIFCGC